LVETCEGLLMVDSAMDDDWRGTLVPYLEAHGTTPDDLRAILVTHADVDHCGGNYAATTANSKIGIWAHDIDAPLIGDLEIMIARRYLEARNAHGLGESFQALDWMRTAAKSAPVTATLRGGERFKALSGEWFAVLHAPGHSEGHLILWFEESRTAIIADAVLHRFVPKKDGTPAFPPTYRYVDPYLRTISTLRGLNIRTLLASHYAPIEGDDVARFFDESASFVEELDEAFFDFLKRQTRGITLQEIVEGIHRELGIWPDGSQSGLVYPLLGHLERAELNGIVTVDTSLRPAIIEIRENGRRKG